MSSKLIQSRLPCPVCPSSDGYHLYDDGHGYCYSCKYHSNPKETNISEEEFTYEYLPLRGISREALAFYDAKTKIDSSGKPVSIGFRYPNGSYKIRSLPNKDFRTEGDIGKAGLFGRDRFPAGSHKYVTITEGELDAVSAWQVLRSPCVSVQSSGTSGRDCTVDRSWLNSFERVILAFDGDSAGRQAAAEVARLLDYNKVWDVRFDVRKDANEYLAHGERDELLNIWLNAKRYQPESIISSLSDFRKILSKPPEWGMPYPFDTLTKMTYGIRTGESVLITAQEGVGKTELMHSIEHHILKENPDVRVGAIFLEEDKRRHLQALAGIEIGTPAHLPDSNCTPDQAGDAVEKLVGMDDRLFLYSHFGSDDPDILSDHIRYLVTVCGCRLVLLDHITMVVSGLAGEDERKALDYLSTRLEMMVRELNFALIIVSHVNDEGKTRGSRLISKIADTRIDISRDYLNPDPIKANTTELVISKNRFGMKTGPAGKLWFNQATYTFKEIRDAQADNDNSRAATMAA